MIVSFDFSLGHRTQPGCTDIREFRCLSVVGKCRPQSSRQRLLIGRAIRADLLNSSSSDDGRWIHMNTQCSSTDITETSGGYSGPRRKTGCVSQLSFTVVLLVVKSSSGQDCQSENTNNGQWIIFLNWTGIAKCRSFQSYRDLRSTSITSVLICIQTMGLISRSIRRLVSARSVVAKPRRRLATYCDRFASEESTFTGLGSSVRRCGTSCAALPVRTRWHGHSMRGTQERRAGRLMSELASLSRTVRTVTTQLLSGTKRQCT